MKKPSLLRGVRFGHLLDGEILEVTYIVNTGEIVRAEAVSRREIDFEEMPP